MVQSKKDEGTLDSSIDFKVHQARSFKHGSSVLDIRLDGIVGDTRCPVGMNCYWPGETIVELSLSDSATNVKKKAYLSQTGRPRDWKRDFGESDESMYENQKLIFGTWTIQMLGVSPAQEQKRKIDPNAYRITLMVKSSIQ